MNYSKSMLKLIIGKTAVIRGLILMAFTILPFQASALLNVITQGDYTYYIDEETLSATVAGLAY